MRPALETIDWGIIAVYVVFALGLGAFFTKKASRNVESFFVGDRKLPWWLAGTSIVATTFAADTPLAVTGIVANGGISGNWLWWNWAIAHLTATFFFARLWRRSGVITDAEITELRYGGRPAAALRVFKAFYFGVFINCLTMAWVISAMVKISGAFFDFEPAVVIAVSVLVSVTYTTLGGFRSVVVTDFIQFGLGMLGAVFLAYYAMDHFGGLGRVPSDLGAGSGLLGALGETTEAAGQSLSDVLDFVPSKDHPSTPLAFFVVLLIAGWWRLAEGNGYIVQRLAACKDERHAQGASLWFAVVHNALRPWPWLVVALAALVVYPRLGGSKKETLSSHDRQVVVSPAELDVAEGGVLRFSGALGPGIVHVGGQKVPLQHQSDGQSFAHFASFSKSGFLAIKLMMENGREHHIDGLRVELKDREMAYPLLMGDFLPPGLLGLVIASLLAAFMSTMDTHTNWGASYLVRDVYQRFLRPSATERQCVRISRLAIGLMGVLAGVSSLFIQDIASVWRFLVTLGAGLGSVTAARWYWSRVTPHAEFAALGVTTVLALVLQLFFTETLFGGPNAFLVHKVPAWLQILVIAGASLSTWIPVSLWGPQNAPETLKRFADRVRPPGPGWRGWSRGTGDPFWSSGLRFFGGLGIVYGSLFGIGRVLLGQHLQGGCALALVFVLTFWVLRRPGW